MTGVSVSSKVSRTEYALNGVRVKQAAPVSGQDDCKLQQGIIHCVVKFDAYHVVSSLSMYGVCDWDCYNA